MIHELQKKFILTAMSAITVLLLLLLGGLNIANIVISYRQTAQRLEMLTRNEQQITDEQTQQEPGSRYQESENPSGGNEKAFNESERRFLNPPMDEDTAMSLRFFVVHTDEDGNVTRMDLGRISAVTEERARTYAAEAQKRGKSFGRIDQYSYRIVSLGGETDDGGETILIFLDIVREQHTILTVLVISIAITTMGWLLMLALVVLLSNRAIRPIAENMKKQKQFVTDAGHELKTPLAIIQANVDAMELINGENKWSKNIRSQTVRLTDLTQNLLTLAKMEESDLNFVRTEVDVSGLIEEILQPFFESAALKGVQIESNLQSAVLAQANKEQLQRLCSILFDNAVKYASQNGRIIVTLEASERTVTLQVKNNCEKLPEGEPGQLFDRFYRGDRARTQKNVGYGIGLAAAKAIVEAHKGSIQAAYKNGNWITFIVKIPKQSGSNR